MKKNDLINEVCILRLPGVFEAGVYQKSYLQNIW